MDMPVNAAAERSRSLWMDVALPRCAPLRASIEVDVAVIGGGMAGLSVAYEMMKLGRSVAVLDRGRLAGGMTSRTTAHLTWALDDYYFKLEKRRSREAALQYFQSQKVAVDRIEAIAESEAIDCDFARLDGLWLPVGEAGSQTLRTEYEAARDLGIDCDFAPPVAGFSGAPLRFPNQGRLHPLHYLAGVAKALLEGGARLFEQSPVDGVEEDKERVRLVANDHAVRARHAVVATNSPVNDLVALHTKQAPYRTYVIAARVPKGAVADRLYWDTLENYHYVRLQPGLEEDCLIVGGEDHKSGLADDGARRIAALESWMRAHFSAAGAVTHAWSGQVYEPVDYVPQMGRNPGNRQVYVITGDSGQGITGAVAGALVIRDLVATGNSPWAEVYEPSRKPLKAAGAYFDENVDVAANLTEHLTGGEIDDLAQLRPGNGAHFRLHGRKAAVYRDEEGGLHAVSATCTHIGCVVQFNSFERCWDCPCHGSQFGVDGDVLAGPAKKPLRPVALR